MGNCFSGKTLSDSAGARPTRNESLVVPMDSSGKREAPLPSLQLLDSSQSSPNPTQDPPLSVSSGNKYTPDGCLILGHQPLAGRSVILQRDGKTILKYGRGLHASEPEAMFLVETHAPQVPIPEYMNHEFSKDHNATQHLWMGYIPGQILEDAWTSLSSETKDRICIDTWNLVMQIRSVPRPNGLKGLWACAADGSPGVDPLLADYTPQPPPLHTDDELRARIYERYLANAGRRHEHDLPDLLPRSNSSVFTHSDIAPRNILIDDEHKIVGLLDWEDAGWYPHYWEFCRILRPQGGNEEGQVGRRDWQTRMEKTAPDGLKCDMQGIKAARRVLF